MRKKKTQSFLGIIIGFLNGLFGSGGGTVAVPFMERYLSVEPHKAHASAIAVILPLSVVSIIFYSINSQSQVNLYEIVSLSLGGIVGGFLGARLLGRLSNKALHRTFGIFMLLAAIKMIL